MTVSSATQAPYGTIQTGTLSGGPLGAASFARAVAAQGGQATIDTIRTNASGQSVQDQVTISANGDGSFSRNVRITGPNGGSVDLALTYGASQGGNRAVSGTITGPNGQTGQVSGTYARTAGSIDQSLAVTGPDGGTASQQDQIALSGSTVTFDETRTGPAGTPATTQAAATVLTQMSLPAGSPA